MSKQLKEVSGIEDRKKKPTFFVLE